MTTIEITTPTIEELAIEPMEKDLLEQENVTDHLIPLLTTTTEDTTTTFMLETTSSEDYAKKR